MVEFVMVFPFILLLFFGVLQAAVVHASRHMVHYAAFRAARAAIVHGKDGKANELANKAAIRACRTLAGYQASRVQVTIQETGDGQSTSSVTATVRYQLELTMPFAGKVAATILRNTADGAQAPPGNFMIVDQVCTLSAQLARNQ